MEGNTVLSRHWLGVVVGMVLAGGVAAQQSTPGAQAGAVLAKVNGVTLYQSQLDTVTRLSGLPDNANTRDTLGKNLIAGEVVRQAAEKSGYGSRADVLEAANAAKARAESELYLRDKVRPDPVNGDQVKARYDAIAAEAGDKEYHIRIVSVGDDAAAGNVLAQLKSGHSFEDVARQYSQASSRAAGGDMGWVTFKTPATEGHTGGIPLPVAQAITDLKAGAYTQTPVVLGQSRVIIRLDDVRPTQLLPFDKASEALRRQLELAAHQKATDTLVQGLVKQAHIER